MDIGVGSPPNFPVARTVRSIVITDTVSDRYSTPFYCGNYDIQVTPDIPFDTSYMTEPAYKAGGAYSEISFETANPDHALLSELGQ